MTFTLGGAVGIGGHYVERAADAAVLANLLTFHSCYIANPRQSGKSSLRKHLARRLRDRGLAVAEIDLTVGGRDPLTKLWGRFEHGISAELTRLGHEPRPWSHEPRDGAPERGLDAYIVDEVLPVHDQGLILFLDELNVLGARDDAVEVFAALRALIERRARCAICFLGVSRPADLVSDPAADPSPLMRAVTLADFTLEEAASFASMLDGFRQPQRIVTACFAQTGGHPYMLQNTLAAAADARAKHDRDDSEDERSAEALIKTIVQDRFFNPETPDPVLETPQHTFSRALDQRALEALNLYRGVIAGKTVPVVSDGQHAQEMLRLAGMVRFDSASIIPRNAIFARRYDPSWVRDLLDRPVYETLATRWRLEDHHPDFLLRGRALESATEMLAAGGQAISAPIADFIRASAKESAQVDPMVTRLRRTLTIALIGMLVVGGVLSGVAIYGRMEAREAARRAIAATRQSLEAELQVARAQKSQAEDQLRSQTQQKAAVEDRVKTLSHNLDQSKGKADELQKRQDELSRKYEEVRQTNNAFAKSIRTQLQEVTREAEDLATERSRLQVDLDAARRRQTSLGEEIQALRQRRDELDAQVKSSRTALEAEKELTTSLSAQLASLKGKIDEASKQLIDVQAKYGECTTQLSATTGELDRAKAQVASCKTGQQQSLP